MATSGVALNQRRYERLIANARVRGCVEGYAEKHHVVPKSHGGTDMPGNLVLLSAREHFIAHWLLFRIYRTPAMARAFRLMASDKHRPRGREYVQARQIMADSMRGDNNVAKRPEVRAKLKANTYSPFAGKKRPDHAEKMRGHKSISGENSHFFGAGYKQLGALNRQAAAVVGIHIYYGVAYWGTRTAAAQALGVTVQAVSQAIRKKQRSKGWRLEKIA